MKVVFANDVVYRYASGDAVVGGAERQQWLLACALAADDCSVAVGVRDGLRAGERKIISRVEFVGIGRRHLHGEWLRFLSAEQPDWWYWRCADPLWGIAVEIAKHVGVRTIFAAAVDNDVQPHRAFFRRRHYWPLYAWGLSRTDRIFVQHTGQFAALAQRWRTKAHIVPSIAGHSGNVTPHTARSEYVAWVAMLRQPKRPDLLVEIARNNPMTRFVVCGGPTHFASRPGYGERVVADLQAQPNIEFLGKVSPKKAREVIANAAVLLSTSDAEGFPNTFLEAWSSGTPVVTLKIDPDQIIERQQLGAVAHSPRRATAEIQSLLRSPARRDEIGNRARRYVVEHHSGPAVASIFKRAVAGALSS